jgi:hypothetical protein
MTPRDRRAVFMGAVVVGGMVLLRLVPWVVRSQSALRAGATEQMELAARARAVVLGLPALEDSVKRTTSAFAALAPQLLASNPADAAADLQAATVNVAAESQVRVMKIEALSEERAGLLTAVRATAELEGDIGGLTQFLASVARKTPVLTVGALRLAVQPGGGPDQPERLRAELHIEGWRLSEKGSR